MAGSEAGIPNSGKSMVANDVILNSWEPENSLPGWAMSGWGLSLAFSAVKHYLKSYPFHLPP